MSNYYGWRPYVPVARRRAQALRKMQALRKRGVDIQPVEIEGRKIAKTFWGKEWCDQMESHGDFANRLPRGRTYVRNGSVCHLAIQKGRIKAMVSGSDLYNVLIKIDVLPKVKWKNVKQRCGGQIGSLLELLQGRISSSVMQVVTDPKNGLFPLPREIHLNCDCPDYATMCKHASAVLYGVGARLDSQPELLFLLRGVNHLDLVTAADESISQATGRGGQRRTVDSGDLGDMFGIDLESDERVPQASTTASKKPASARKKKAKTAKRVTIKRKSKRASAANPVKTEIAESGKQTAKKKVTKKKVSKKKAGAKKKTAKQPARKTSTRKTSKSKKARKKAGD